MLGEGFEERARYRIGGLRCGESLRCELWDLLYSVTLGQNTPTAAGRSKVPKEFEDVRSVLAIVRRSCCGSWPLPRRCSDRWAVRRDLTRLPWLDHFVAMAAALEKEYPLLDRVMVTVDGPLLHS